MINLDRYALECDLAETYHIYNIKELPLSKVALFSYGLRENSRIKLKMNNMKYSFETMMMAGILDKLSILVWSKSDEASKGTNKPESILAKLLGIEQSTEKDHVVFNSSNEFETARLEILNLNKEKDNG